MSELDQLNQIDIPLHFMSFAIDQIEVVVDDLLQSSFRQDEYATKYALNPLLGHNGPLNELPIKLKLIFGLGIITKESYQDLELLLKLREKTKLNNGIDFLDPLFINAIKKLHIAKGAAIVEQKFKAAKSKKQSNDSINEGITMQLQRQQRIIRAALILAVSDICDALKRDNLLRVHGALVQNK